MATKQKQPNNKRRFISYLRQNPKEAVAFAVILILVLTPLVIIGVNVHNNYSRNRQIAKQRAALNAADGEIGKVITQIIATNPPAARDISRGCDYASSFNEFDKGDLVCEVVYGLSYPATSPATAKSQAQAINRVLRRNSKFTFIGASDDALNTPPPLDVLWANYKYRSLDCFVTYRFYAQQKDVNPYKLRLITNQTSMVLRFSCAVRPAKANLFS